MDESPEYVDEINRLKEEARIQKIKKKAQEDYKAEIRAEKSRQRAERYEKFRRENHIEARHWVPIAIGAGVAIGTMIGVGQLSTETLDELGTTALTSLIVGGVAGMFGLFKALDGPDKSSPNKKESSNQEK